MPAYSTYTNESDSRFAGQLDDYKLGLPMPSRPVSDGVMADSAFAVMPEMMALRDVMQSRMGAHAASMGTRRSVRDDWAEAEADDEYNGFLQSLPDMRGKSQQERAAIMEDAMFANPSSFGNERISGTVNRMFEASNLRLKARQNALAESEMSVKERFNNAVSPEDQSKALVDDYRLKVAQAETQQDMLFRTRRQLEAGDYANLGTAFTGFLDAEGRDKSDEVIKLHEKLSRSDDPVIKNAMGSIVSVAGNMAIGRNLVGALRSKVGQYSTVLNNFANNKIDVSKLTGDPATDAPVIEQIEAYLASDKSSGTERIMAKEMLATLSRSISVDKQFKDAQAQIFETIKRISELASDASPEAKDALLGELAVFNARSGNFANTYQQMMADEKRDLEMDNKRSQITKRQQDLVLKIRSANATDRAQLHREYRDNLNLQFRAAGSVLQRQGAFSDFVNDGFYKEFGFDEQPTYEQWEARMQEEASSLAPSGGRPDLK